MIKNITLILFLFFVSSNSFSQEKQKTYAQKIAAARISFLTDQLSLTSEQAEKFWPVYNKGKNEMYSFNKERNTLQKKIDFKTVSEVEAKKLVLKIDSFENSFHKRKQQLNQDLTTVLSYKQILKLKDAEVNFKKKLLERIKKTK
ncbi:hypothetical protein FHR24_002605 [Wenyingzhuangia heitensis]|uniref:Sensor of ECF-type sigma factor n=1 Tax=Wenyingzhuangia heitensis TaxID=1487859 RepID=A0ABX0UGJ0_9FLAO|nr:hypothetical protein [Wenyingzhuangia heitensis]NIJ46127.1 hypothetical protein [Wenyingzhuangia heitensis]